MVVLVQVATSGSAHAPAGPSSHTWPYLKSKQIDSFFILLES